MEVSLWRFRKEDTIKIQLVEMACLKPAINWTILRIETLGEN
jgi:hypothetical protein